MKVLCLSNGSATGCIFRKSPRNYSCFGYSFEQAVDAVLRTTMGRQNEDLGAYRLG